MIVENINILLSLMYRSCRQKINKEILVLYDMIVHILLKHILSRTDHMLGHRTSCNKFKMTEIIANIFTDQNDMKLGINWKNKMEVHKYVEIQQHSIIRNQHRNHKILQDKWKYK